MLSPYQLRLRAIRDKELPSASQVKKMVGSKSYVPKKAAALSHQLLMKQAQLVFNAWIRNRDMDKGCVSCKSKLVVHASHYYPAGSFGGLRFLEINAHGSCERCNTFLYGNSEAYRKELLNRIGKKALDGLDRLAFANKRKKYSRTELLEIIGRYRI